jgi:hypothetical protein
MFYQFFLQLWEKLTLLNGDRDYSGIQASEVGSKVVLSH